MPMPRKLPLLTSSEPLPAFGQEGRHDDAIDRLRVAAHINQPRKFVRLLDPKTNDFLQDSSSTLPGDIAVVVGF